MRDNSYIHSGMHNATPNPNLFQILDEKKEQETNINETKTMVQELKGIANIGIKELKKRVKAGNIEDKDLIRAVNSCIEKMQLLSGKATNISVRKTMTKEQMLIVLAKPSEAAKIAEVSFNREAEDKIDKKGMVIKLLKGEGRDEA